MTKALLFGFFTVVLFLPIRAYAYCYGLSPWDTTSGHVCGEVYKLGHNGYHFLHKPAGWTNMKICPAGQLTGCTTVGTSGHTDAYGGPVMAFLFYRFVNWAEGYRLFDLYAWSASSADYWGSDTVPALRNVWIGPQGHHGIQVEMLPRPLDPTPVYPTGANVGNSYLVRWKSGRDIDRNPHAITYDIWYKYWPFGGTEPANFTLARAGMPCHDNGSNAPDSNNECTTFIAGPQPAGNWKWHVVANLSWGGGSYTTKSGDLSFTQPNP
jgi:hypothetical protein